MSRKKRLNSFEDLIYGKCIDLLLKLPDRKSILLVVNKLLRMFGFKETEDAL